MTRDEFEGWALTTARKIVEQEESEFALASRKLNVVNIETESTMLGVAIVKALIAAYEAGGGPEA